MHSYIYWYFSSKIKMDLWWLVHGTQDPLILWPHLPVSLVSEWLHTQSRCMEATGFLEIVEIVTFLDWAALLRSRQGWEVICPSNLNSLYGTWTKKKNWTLGESLQCTWLQCTCLTCLSCWAISASLAPQLEFLSAKQTKVDNWCWLWQKFFPQVCSYIKSFLGIALMLLLIFLCFAFHKKYLSDLQEQKLLRKYEI